MPPRCIKPSWDGCMQAIVPLSKLPGFPTILPPPNGNRTMPNCLALTHDMSLLDATDSPLLFNKKSSEYRTKARWTTYSEPWGISRPILTRFVGFALKFTSASNDLSLGIRISITTVYNEMGAPCRPIGEYADVTRLS